jgi:hypothetical protein
VIAREPAAVMRALAAQGSMRIHESALLLA